MIQKSLVYYKKNGVLAIGKCIKENEMSDYILDLLTEIKPDIVVITGHDYYNKQGLKDLANYKNTAHFIDAIAGLKISCV